MSRSDVVVAGARTAYRTHGDPGLPTLVAVHGLRGTHHGLVPLVTRLRDYRMIVPDLPGFGESSPLPDGRPHDVNGYTVWLTEFLEAVGASDAVLFGHSFGSVLAAAAVAAGTPVRALVLLNPITRPSENPLRRVAGRTALLAHRAADRLPETVGTAALRTRLLTDLMSTVLMTTEDPDLRRWIRDEHRRHFGSFASPRVLAEAFEAASYGCVDDHAPRIGAPTVLIAGGRDRLVPPEGQRVLAGRFPDARLAVIPGTGHLTHYECPDVVAHMVDGHVRSTQDAGTGESG